MLGRVTPDDDTKEDTRGRRESGKGASLLGEGLPLSPAEKKNLVSMMMLQKINRGNGSRRIIDQLGLVVRQGEEGESSFIPNIQTSRKTLVIMGIYGE